MFFDIQGVQSRAHVERGIGRYLVEAAAALDRWHPGLVERFLLNPDFEVPGSLEPLTTSGRLQFSDRVDARDASIYHVGSPLEPAVPLVRLWPKAAQSGGARLVVTLHDLIPQLLPDRYLTDPLTRKRYEARIGLVRRADRVLATSTATADDAVTHLGVRPERVTVVGTGLSSHFQETADRLAALATVQASLPAVDAGFLLYTGGIDPGKDIARLLEAYSALPEALRRAHQLVVVSEEAAAQRTELDETLHRLRIGDRVVIAGFVPDELLVALYQSTALFVFPSLYEGVGLPVAEAIACGAPLAVSRIRATNELVPEPAAQFDPTEPRAIAEAVSRCLSDPALNDRLRALRIPAWASWESVAERTAAAYTEVAATGRRARRRRRPRVAVVAPLPPQRSGVAEDSYRLIEALTEHVDVDAIADGPLQGGSAPPGVRVVGTRNFDIADALVGTYDQVFYCLANSRFHSGALELLVGRPGVVIAHDVLLGEAIARSDAFLVHSDHAAQLARLAAAREDEHKIEVIPFRCPAPGASSAEPPGWEDDLLVATFGFVSQAKQTAKLIEAWRFVTASAPTANLAIVGSEAEPGERDRLERLTLEFGLGATVTQTGDVSEEAFRAWIGRAAVAVQLRAGSTGDSLAVVPQALAAGVPTIVTDIGAARELPDDAVVKVHRDITPPELADAIVRLLRAPERRAALSSAGRRLAAEHSYERVAKLLYDRHIVPARRQRSAAY